jgi:hypothetical protein
MASLLSPRLFVPAVLITSVALGLVIFASVKCVSAVP